MGANDKGILICHTANGMAITANKYGHIRTAVCQTQDIAELARKHNDINVLCIPAGFVDNYYEVVDRFLEIKFEGGRHQRRVEKIPTKYSDLNFIV